MAANHTGFWQRARRWLPWLSHVHREAPTEPASGGEVGRRAGGYVLQDAFASGAMGVLHWAVDPRTQTPVAIKFIAFGGSDITRERFVREAAAAARLRHPRIVATLASGFDADDGGGWLAQEWVPGHDLSRYGQHRHLLPEAVVLEVAARVADGLAHAHDQGVIHRDLKPANILVNLPQGVVKIADFGCALLSDTERSRSGLLIGTPAYMAPEQVLGAPVDGRCDLYALGVVVFQLLTGRLPFESNTLGTLLTQIASEPPPTLRRLRPDLPPLLSDMLARAMAKNPAQRQAQAKQMAREFRLIAVGLAAKSAGAAHPGEAQ